MGWAVAPLVSMAISLGSQLLLSLFQKSPKQEDPSLQVPKSDYGVGIPKIYGRVRLEGNKFFPQTSNLMYEIRNERSSSGGGKGGGRSRTTNEKKVYGSIALLYCEGKTTLEKIIIQGEHIETNHPFYQQYCTWFDGTQDQVWSVVAQDEEPYKFIKYKNVAYLGIEKMPLDRYGNQIPSQISAVLVDGVFGAQPTLDRVVGDILTRAGIDSGLWDVTDLNMVLRDGVVVRQSGESYREAIESLMELYLFAPYQDNDGKIIFRRIRRGDSSVVNLDNRYFVENEDGGSYISEIKSDFELPTKLSVKFFNTSRVYEQDEVNVYLGNKSESENNVKSVSETLYTYPYEAEERAREILSYFYSLEKNSFKFKLPIYYYSQFNCLDVVTLPNGQTVQITKINIGADYTVEITATYYDSVQSSYVSTPDSAIIPPVLTDPPIPQIFILDVPVINNDLPGSLYCFATSGPATIEFSDNNGNSWSYATNHLYASIIGECVDVIGSSVTVNVISGGGLESITQDEFDVEMGQNLCLIGRETTGGYYEGEFIQFRDAVLVGSNQYTLSTFKRGLNNTGSYQHVSGERLFLFKGVGSYYSIIPGNASFLGLNLSFRAIVSDWQNLATTPTVSVTPSGNAYKPPAPTNLTGVIDVEGNIKLFWEYSNAFSPYNNSQETVSYEISIEGIRTLTSNSKDVFYLVGDRTTDNLTPPLNVTVWAVSSVVGKGYPLIASVNPSLVSNSILGTGIGLQGITQIYGNYTVQESDNNKIIVGYTNDVVEYIITFPDTLSNGFTCWVCNAWGNNFACFFTISGTNNLTRIENNRIKTGDSRQFLHVSNGNYFVIGKNQILYDFTGLTANNSVLATNSYTVAEAVGITLIMPDDAVEGDFIGIATRSDLDYSSNPVVLTANVATIEGGNSFSISGANERYLFYFAGTDWVYLSRYVDDSANFQNSLLEGDNIDLVYDSQANTTTIGVTGLATVATTGSYTDLSDKPIIPNLTVKDSEGSFTQVGIVDFGSQFDVTYTGEPNEVNVSLRDETIDDRVNDLLIAGNNITLTYNDNLNTLTIDSVNNSLSYELKTANFTASSNTIYFVDTSNGQVSCTLPLSPVDGDVIGIIDRVGSNYQTPTGFGLNACQVLASSSQQTIQGFTSITLAWENTSLFIRFYDGKWNYEAWNRNFSTAQYYELIDNRVANLLVAGSNVTLDYDDTANTLTINSSGGGGSSTDITDIWLYGG